MSNGSKVLIYLSFYLSASISRIVDSNPQGLISSVLNSIEYAQDISILRVCYKMQNLPFLAFFNELEILGITLKKSMQNSKILHFKTQTVDTF